MSKIAFVLADDFEDTEFSTPKSALTDAGHDVDVIGTDLGIVTGKHGTEVSVTTLVTDADPSDYAALVIPGGFSPDHLRTDDHIVEFVQQMAARDVPIAAVCHAPSLLIEAGLVNGRTMTSWPSIRTDLENAGADVVDEEVVIDGQFISSRNPDDLPAFTAAILERIAS